MKAFGQDVQQKSADELVRMQRHLLITRSAFAPIILPLEGDAGVVELEQATVGDGDAMGIAREKAQHLFRTAERALGIDDPFGHAYRCQIAREGLRIRQRCMLAKELQLSGSMRRSEFLQNQPSKQRRQHLHGEEEVGTAGNPTGAVKREPAAGHDHVDMGMMAPTPTIP